MKSVDYQSGVGYVSTEEEEITVAGILQNLRAELAKQEAMLADVKYAIRQLHAAIDAVERVEALSKPEGEHQYPVKTRGYLIGGVIGALRDGIGSIGPIVQRLQQQGIKTTKASVSNTLQRLRDKGLVCFDDRKQLWSLTPEATNGEAVQRANGIYQP